MVYGYRWSRQREGVYFCDSCCRITLHVHAEINGGIECAGGDDRHNRDERFQAHRAITDGSRVRLARQNFRSGAAGDERVKTGDRAASNRDETKWKDFARHDRPGTIDEAADGGHLQMRQDKKYADGERENRAQLHKGAEIVSRRQQQPHRQDAGRQAVTDDGFGKLHLGQSKPARPRVALINQLSAPDRQQQQDDADGRCFQYFPDASVAQVTTHQQRDGDGCADGKDAPRTVGQRLDHDQGKHGQKDDHDRDNRDQPDRAGGIVEFFPQHLAERFAVAAKGTEKNNEILHCAAERYSDQNPERARQIAELRGEHRAYQRPRAGNGGKMVAKHNPFIGFNEIPAIIVDLARCGAAVVEHEHARRQPFRIKAIADGVTADRRDEHVSGTQIFVSAQRQRGIRARPAEGEENPEQLRSDFLH